MAVRSILVRARPSKRKGPARPRSGCNRALCQRAGGRRTGAHNYGERTFPSRQGPTCPYSIYANTSGQINLTGLTTVTVTNNGAKGYGLISNANGRLFARRRSHHDLRSRRGFGYSSCCHNRICGWVRQVVAGDATIDVTGAGAAGIMSRGANSLVSLNNLTGTITTTTNSAVFIEADAGGTTNIAGAIDLTVQSTSSAYGIWVNNGGIANLTDHPRSTSPVHPPLDFCLWAAELSICRMLNSPWTPR